MNYLSGLINLVTSLVISTIIIYAINFIAGFAGADYSFTNGEVFVMWILMAILVNNCKPYYKKNIIFNSLLTLPPSPFSKYEKK